MTAEGVGSFAPIPAVTVQQCMTVQYSVTRPLTARVLVQTKLIVMCVTL